MFTNDKLSQTYFSVFLSHFSYAYCTYFTVGNKIRIIRTVGAHYVDNVRAVVSSNVQTFPYTGKRFGDHVTTEKRRGINAGKSEAHQACQSGARFRQWIEKR